MFKCNNFFVVFNLVLLFYNFLVIPEVSCAYKTSGFTRSYIIINYTGDVEKEMKQTAY